MALEVEDGTGKANAESYVSAANCATYAAARGLIFATGGAQDALNEQALRRATTWLDANYRSRFTGRRLNGREQALEWPRSGAYDTQDPPDYLASDEIPVEIINATCEAAVREKADPGVLSPDVTPGQIAKRERVEGVVDVEYFNAGRVDDQRLVATVIDDILAPILSSGSTGSNPYVGRAVRA